MWIEKINEMKSLTNYKLNWSDFGLFFKTLNDQVNEYLDGEEKNKADEAIIKKEQSNESITKENKQKLNNSDYSKGILNL